MSAGPATAHRPAVKRRPAPSGPRRVSGPARGRVPAHAAPRRRAAAPAVALPQPLVPRVADALRDLPDARWLDRLVRGRAWIAIIGVALIGLVFMQVSMLEMNAGIGQSVEHAATLERQNSDLRATVSQLSSEERIQREAMEMGLQMPAAGDVRFLTSRGAQVDATEAVKIMRSPNAVDDLAAATALTTTEPITPVTPAAAAATEPQATPTPPVADPNVTPVAETTTPVAPQPEPQAEPVTPAATSSGAVAAPGSGQ